MSSFKVNNALSLLSPEEIGRFERWLIYKLNGQQERVYKFFQELKNQSPKAKLWQSLYPDIPYKSTRRQHNQLSALASNLNRLLTEFLATEMLQKDTFFQDFWAFKYLEDCGSYNGNLNQILAAKKRLSESPLRNAKYYFQLYELELEHQSLVIKYLSPTNGKNMRNTAIIYAFERWVLLEQLLLANMELNHFHSYNYKPCIRLSEEMKNRLNNPDEFQDTPLIRIHFELYELQQYEKGVSFDTFLQIFQEFHAQIENGEFLNLFHVASNYLIRKINETGDSYYKETLYRLYEWAIREQLVYEGKNLPTQHYTNLITNGLQLGKFEEVYGYIQDYKDALIQEHRDEAFFFNLAKYYFANKEYVKTIKELDKITTYHHKSFEIPGRLLKILALHETNADEDFEKALETLSIFVKNQKNLSKPSQSRYLQLLKLTNRLIKVRGKTYIERLYRDLQKTPRSIIQFCLLAVVERKL